MIVAVVVVACLCGAWFAYALHEKQDADKELAAAATAVTDLQRDQREFSETVRVQTDTALLTQQLTTVMANDLDWAALLAALRSAGTPSRIALDGVNGTAERHRRRRRRRPTRCPAPRRWRSIGSITVTGAAPDKKAVAAYADALAKQSVVTNPYVTSVADVTDGNGVTFSLKADITPDVALRPVHRQVQVLGRQLMGARHADRLWIIAGMAVIALLAVATWFLAVSPQRTEAAGLARPDRDVPRTGRRAPRADRQADGRQGQPGRADEGAERRARSRCPRTRAYRSSCASCRPRSRPYGVDVSSVAVADPAQEETVPGVWSVEIKLNADGTLAKTGRLPEAAAERRAEPGGAGRDGQPDRQR